MAARGAGWNVSLAALLEQLYRSRTLNPLPPSTPAGSEASGPNTKEALLGNSSAQQGSRRVASMNAETGS